MNIRSLVCFKTVAEMKHFTKAAQQLYLTQSALSKMMGNLEIELKVSLFEKDGRNVVLTPAGEAFYKHVVCALDEINAGIKEAQHQEELKVKSIKMSIIISAYASQLPEKILSFQRQYPGCYFSVEYKYTSAVISDLLNGSCELCICGDFSPDGRLSDIARHLLCQYPTAIAVGKHHRLADRDIIDVEELKNENFVVWNRSRFGNNKLLIDICEEHGFTPNLAIEGRNNLGVLNAVATGAGIAMVSLSDDMEIGSDIKILQLNVDPPPMRDIYLAWNKKRKLSLIATKFRDFLIEMAREE